MAKAKKAARKPSRKPAKKAATRARARKTASTRNVVRKTAAAPRIKDGRPPNYHAWLTPYLTVRDVGESLRFYERAFGFAAGVTMPDKTGRILHGEASWNGHTLVMMGPENPQMSPMKPPAASGTAAPLSLYVYCKSVDAVHARASAASAKVVQAPADQFWGDRTAVFEDPDGYHWTFATNVGAFDPSKAPF